MNNPEFLKFVRGGGTESLFGLFPLLVGAAWIYAVIVGLKPHPKLLAWLVYLVFLMVGCVILGYGIWILCYRSSVVIDSKRHEVTLIWGLPVTLRTKVYPLHVFEAVTICQDQRGVFVKRPCYSVHLSGPNVDVFLKGDFDSPAEAHTLADCIAAYTGIVVQDKIGLPAE